MMEQIDKNMLVETGTAPIQFDEPELAFDIEADNFIWATRAREAFDVSGKGLAVAVLGTGINKDHVDFAGRIIATHNFTGDDITDVTDRVGSGTHVTGLIAANGDHIGIAPEVNIVYLKVLGDNSVSSFQALTDGLQWILDHWQQYNISAVCMNIGDGGNYTSDEMFTDEVRKALRAKIATFARNRIAVCIPSGNDYVAHHSTEGMSFPAIIRECISVGAVYDAEEGSFSYGNAKAFSSKPGQITPFSQRLHQSTNLHTHTTIFAPGAPATSSGTGLPAHALYPNNPHGESTEHGTSRAAPIATGVVLLMQQFYQRMTGELPSIEQIKRWLWRGGVSIFDGDDENDSVEHTNKYYKRIDALSALDAVRRELQKQRLPQ